MMINRLLDWLFAFKDYKKLVITHFVAYERLR